MKRTLVALLFLVAASACEVARDVPSPATIAAFSRCDITPSDPPGDGGTQHFFSCYEELEPYGNFQANDCYNPCPHARLDCDFDVNGNLSNCRVEPEGWAGEHIK